MTAIHASLTFGLSVVAAVAQAPRLRNVHQVLPAFRGYGDRHAVGDVTGDGVDDIVFVARALPGVVWRGSADGVFTRLDGALPVQAETCNAMVLVDVDGDLDLDCVVANPSGQDRVYVNDGSGAFAESPLGPLPNSSGASNDVTAGDVDGDGDQDLVVARATVNTPFPLPPFGENFVYLNDGSGAFTLATGRLPASNDDTTAVALFDYDGDGDDDVYVGNRPFSLHPGTGRLYANDGFGAFSEVPLPGAPTVDQTMTVFAADFDRDGEEELLTFERTGAGYRFLRYLDDDATGTFGAMPTFPPLPSGSRDQILIGDWNADGDVDYAVRAGDRVHAFVFAAAGLFTPSALPPAVIGPRPVVAYDYERDGDSDLIAPSSYLTNPVGTVTGVLESALLRNTGAAWTAAPDAFAALPQPPTTSGVATYLVDIDGDGHLDIVWAPGLAGVGGAIHLGDGNGAFTPAPAGDLGLPSARANGLVFGDFDGDDDLDIVCVFRQEPYVTNPTSKLFRNDAGALHEVPFPALYAEQIVAGDFDGDDDLDLIVDGFLADAVLLNDGTGTLTELPGALPAVVDPLIPNLTTPLQVCDLNGDDHLDLAVYYRVYQYWGVLINDGSAHFTVLPVPGLSSSPTYCADFDGDLDVDLLVEGGQYPAGAPHTLFLNDGSAGFTPVSIPSTGSYSVRTLIVFDIDQDGLPDIVEAACGVACDGASQRILWNLGGGSFTALPTGELEWPLGIWDARLGDVDEDGDTDALLVDINPAGNRLYRNLHHQLVWRTLPRVGDLLRLDLFGRANEPLALGYALGRAALPLGDLSTLRLDPASLVVVGTDLYDGQGHTEFTAPVPNVPAFVGLSIYWQALSGATAPRLGNLETTMLQPH